MDAAGGARSLSLAATLAASVLACAHPTAPAANPPPAAAAVPVAAAPAPPAAATATAGPPGVVSPAGCYLRDGAPLAGLRPPSDKPSAPGSIFQAAPTLVPAAGGAANKPGASEQVRGSVDKEVIRRVIRRHIGEVKACYEPAVAAHPYLAGTIGILFLIAPSGIVTQTHVNRSTMGYPVVEECIARAMCGWQFPPPIGGGSVLVDYPYKLAPAAAPTDP